MNLHTIFGILVTIGGFIPVVAGVFVYKKLSNEIKYFYLYSVYAFLTDLFVGILYNFKISILISKILFMLFPFVEAIFLFWFLGFHIQERSLKKLSYGFIFLIIPYYAIAIYYLGTNIEGSYFNSVYNILVSFLSGYVLLQAAEKYENMSSEPIFWFTLCIFTYAFGTFFMFSIFDSGIRNHIWFLHNIITIISYCFAAYGFVRIKKQNTVSQLS